MTGFDTAVDLAYLLAATAFVLGLHLMNSPATARRGNRLSAAGMALAVATTLAVVVHTGDITATGWAVLGAGVMLVSFRDKNHTPVIYWQIFLNCIFGMALFVAVSERPRLGRRVLAAIPDSRVKRALVFPFYSGSASGLFWTCTGIGLTQTAAWLWSRFFPTFNNLGDLSGSRKWIGAMCLYFFCYAMSAALLRRRLLSGVTSDLTWLISLIFIGCGSVIPFMIGYLLYFGDHWWDQDVYNWLVGNPFAWNDKSDMYLGVAVVWAGIIALFNLPWFIRSVRGFRPTRRKGEAKKRDYEIYENNETYEIS